MSRSDPRVAFLPLDAFGHVNNCVGIADVLRRRGVRPVFLLDESWAGRLAAQGFEEIVLRAKPAPLLVLPSVEFYRRLGPHFREDPYQQLGTVARPLLTRAVERLLAVDDHLAEVLAELRPRAVVIDDVAASPAVLASGFPWAWMLSTNPLQLTDPALPPPGSGLPATDRTGWDVFWREIGRQLASLWARLNAACRARGAPPLPLGAVMPYSPWLTMYHYPGDADYARASPLPPTVHRIESIVRATESAFVLPESLRGEGKLVYVSLGTLGNVDAALLGRLVDLAGRAPHRFIVSLGPQAATLEPRLPANVWGAAYLPQPSILPLVDAVVTHGGNITVIECFHFGKPMLAMSLFGDHHSNAQRVAELGFGHRLQTHTFTDDAFFAALQELLENDERRERMGRIATRLQSAPGTERAADLIGRLAETQEPVVAA